jgi:DNA repair exonuclease SbcCD ATPase subunit
MLNSDVLKSGISTLSTLITIFGNLPTIIGVATTALLLWKGEAIKTALVAKSNGLSTFIENLMSAVATEGVATIATSELSIAFNNLKLAIATNPLGILAVAVTTIISLFDIFGDSTEKDAQKIQELNQAIEKNNNQIKSLQDLQKQYVELSSKTSLSTEESKKLQDIQNQLAQQCPQLVDHYDALGNAYLKNADAIDQEVTALKKKNAEEEKSKLDIYDKQNNSARRSIEANSDLIKKAKPEEIQKGVLAGDDDHPEITGLKISQLNAEIKTQSELLETNSKNIRNSSEAYVTLDASLQKIVDSMSTDVTNSYKQGKMSTTDYANAIDDLSKKLASTTITDAYSNYKKLAEAQTEGKAKVEDVKSAYDKLHEALSNAGVSESYMSKYMADTTSSMKDQKSQANDLKDSIDNLSKAYSKMTRYSPIAA